MFLDLLAMQTFLPNVGTLDLFKISSTPKGVAGMNRGSPRRKRPEGGREGERDKKKEEKENDYGVSKSVRQKEEIEGEGNKEGGCKREGGTMAK